MNKSSKLATMTSTDLNFLKDFPPGPLDAYRKDASFDWKQMALFLEGEELLRYKVFTKTLEKRTRIMLYKY